MSSTYSGVLLKYQEDLESSLNGVDLTKLSRDLLRSRVLSKEVYDKFTSLDSDNLESEIQVRYLLLQIRKRIKEDGNVYGRLVKILGRLGGEVRRVCETIKEAVESEVRKCSSVDSKSGNEILLVEANVPYLVNCLVSCSHLWEEIGIALKLPKHKLVDCGEGGTTCVSRLNNVINTYVLGDYEGAVPPANLYNLKEALASDIVNQRVLAHSLDAMYHESIDMPTYYDTKSNFEITDQTYDTEVLEGKSTLLEVDFSGSGSESYQWSKDGQPLKDGVDYSGVYSKMLYISKATPNLEGKYLCCITHGNDTYLSEEINVEVIYPPEKKELIQFYSVTEKGVPQDSWPPVANSAFVNLVLVSPRPMSTCHYYTVRGDVDDILESKEVAEYGEVFGEFIEGALVLLEGRPGSGKTTLVHKLTRDWSEGKKVLQGAKMVFLVTLRLLNVSEKDKSLLDLLRIFYGENLSENVGRSLQEGKGKGACFILDGLDEYSIGSKDNSVISELLYTNSFLPLSMVIVASRPVATDRLRNSCKTRIEVLGFSKDQIYSFVETYPFHNSDMDMASKMKEFLGQHPNVQNMCYLPVHAAMICFLFSKLGNSIPHRETQIYEKFAIATLLRHMTLKTKGQVTLKSLMELCGEEKTQFNSICKLAFDMITNSQQVICRTDSSSSFSNDLALGFLTVERISEYYGSEDLYTFHHLTFQEFLAAFYLHNAQLENEEMLGQKNLKKVLKFYCGLVQSIRNIEFAKQICESDYYTKLFKIQCAFESQQKDLCNHVVGDGNIEFVNGLITSVDFIGLGYVISEAMKPVTRMTLHGCRWDCDGVNAFASIASSIKLRSITCLQVYISSDEMFVALNNLLSHLLFLEELNLTEVKLSKSRIECLTRDVTLYHLKVLKISLPLISCSFPEEVLKALKFCSQNFKQVFYSVDGDCSANHVVWRNILCYTFGCQVLFETSTKWLHIYNSITVPSLANMRLSCCVEIVLINCGIGDEEAEMLTTAATLSALESLILDFNRISDSGGIALANFLAGCRVMRKVSFQCNSLGNSGATALANVLAQCSSLRKLDLQGNCLGDKGAVAIAKVTSRLAYLDLCMYNVNITEEGIRSILEQRPGTKVRNMEFASSWYSISEVDIDTLKNALHSDNLPAIKITPTNTNMIEKLVGKIVIANVRGIECDKITNDALPTLCSIIDNFSDLHYVKCNIDGISTTGENLLSDSLKLCSSLRSLIIKNFRSRHSGLLDVVKCCTKLCHLDLSGGEIYTDCVGPLFSNFESWVNLHTLNLSDSVLQSDGAVILGGVLSHCMNLCCLNLMYNMIDDVGAVAVAEGLQGHTSIQELSIGNNFITAKGMAAFNDVIRNNCHLNTLELSNSYQDSQGVSNLVEAICGNNLQRLYFSANKLGAKGVADLSVGLQKYTQLNELDIRFNIIQSLGLINLAEGLQHCTNLQVLHLGSNAITSDGVPSVLKIMKSCKYLERLNLSDNNIDVDDAAAIVGGWQHGHVLTLWLISCFDDPHDSALVSGMPCCDSCDNLLQLYHYNDYMELILEYRNYTLPKPAF